MTVTRRTALGTVTAATAALLVPDVARAAASGGPFTRLFFYRQDGSAAVARITPTGVQLVNGYAAGHFGRWSHVVTVYDGTRSWLFFYDDDTGAAATGFLTRPDLRHNANQFVQAVNYDAGHFGTGWSSIAGDRQGVMWFFLRLPPPDYALQPVFAYGYIDQQGYFQQVSAGTTDLFGVIITGLPSGFVVSVQGAARDGLNVGQFYKNGALVSETHLTAGIKFGMRQEAFPDFFIGGWQTHIIHRSLHTYVLFYDTGIDGSASGSAAICAIDRQGQLRRTAYYYNGTFTNQVWSHIVTTSQGLFFYASQDGAAMIGQLNASAVQQTASFPAGSFEGGWDNIVAY